VARSVAEIDADLVLARAARLKALSASEYSIDSGQSRQSVKRSLPDINATITALEDERADAVQSADGSGMLSLTFKRRR
jgi:hypothetical protein